VPDTLPQAGARLLAAADRALHDHKQQTRLAVERRVEPRVAADASATIHLMPEAQQIARIAAGLLGLPTAFLVVKKGAGLTIVGHHGLGDRAVALEWCLVGFDQDALVVHDAARDRRFKRAATEAHLGFLAAASLRDGCDGAPLGALWVADRVSRASWGAGESALLRQLADLAGDSLDTQQAGASRPLRVA
jgi:GAF domain-containing protein